MSQKRIWNYKDDDLTVFLTGWLTGIIQPGLYFGYDIVPGANMNLVLGHATTGFKDVDTTYPVPVESAKQGLVVTRQGTVIKENATLAAIPITVGDLSNPRIDVIVVTHKYNPVAGGQQALYSVITGTPAGSPVAPALTDALNQIKIGELYIPTGTVALTDVGVVWTRAAAPGFAGISFTANRVVVSNGSGNPASSTITTTELGLLSGLVVNVQTGKQDTITGAATTILSSNLTADRAVVSNGAGKIIASSASATEVTYLVGVTSSIQTQLNGKQATVTGAASTIVTAPLSADFVLVSNGIGKVAVSTIDTTTLNFLTGLFVNVQTGKQDTITGAATTILSANLTADRAVVSNGSGKIIASSASATEVTYLVGVTSAIQTQLNGKQATVTGAATTIVSSNLTANRTLVSDGSGKVAVSSITDGQLVSVVAETVRSYNNLHLSTSNFNTLVAAVETVIFNNSVVGPTNFPIAADDKYYKLSVSLGFSDLISQVVTGLETNKIYSRYSINAGSSWSGWFTTSTS